MLKSGYFTNRNEIIDWINSILHIQMTKIEQLGSGNIYCHLLDAAYPSKVPLQKVKWSAYLEIDFIYNFKILQNCFEHLGINKNIEVQKLVKAKYQDNLEFIQWMKYEFNQTIKNNNVYDALQRRNNANIYFFFTEKLQKNLQNKSTSNLMSHCSNKENGNHQNYLESPRISLKQPRNTNGSLTLRQRQIQQNPRKRRDSFITVVSKTDNTLLEKPRLNRNSNRIHTESGQLILCKRLYTEFILQTQEEECF